MAKHIIFALLFLTHELKASDINVRVFGMTPLLIDLYEGLEEEANKLLDQGADANLATDQAVTYHIGTPFNIKSFTIAKNTSPLHAVAESSYEFSEDLIEKLLEKGANIDAQNAFGATPLVLAASLEKLSLVEILLSHKANAKIKSTNNGTALIFAATPPTQMLDNNQPIDWKKRLIMVNMLLEKGASLKEAERKGHSVLFHLMSAIVKRPSICSDDCIPLIKLLLSEKLVDETAVINNLHRMPPQIAAIIKDGLRKKTCSFYAMPLGALALGTALYLCL